MPAPTEANDFDILVTPTALGDNRFSVEIPDGWQQGRGAFGGLVLATLVRAAESAAADPTRALRSLTAQIVGPVQPGQSDIKAEILRAGSGMTAVATRLVQVGTVQAHAVAVFAKTRPTYAAPTSLTAPNPRTWRELPSIPVSMPLAPTFTQHVELWPTGPLPFSGASDAAQETAGWVRLRHPGRTRDAAFTVALVDCYWPSFLTTATQPRAAATLTFSMETMADLQGLDPDAPFFYRARILGGRDGFAVEARELWGEDGRLVALNQQIFAVIQ